MQVLEQAGLRLMDFVGRGQQTPQGVNLTVNNATFGNNTSLVAGNSNQTSVTNKTVTTNNDFNALAQILRDHQLPEDNITELKNILAEEESIPSDGRFGPKTNGWISKALSKSLDGSWAIGIGAAGKLLADAIKAYYHWPA